MRHGGAIARYQEAAGASLSSSRMISIAIEPGFDRQRAGRRIHSLPPAAMIRELVGDDGGNLDAQADDAGFRFLPEEKLGAGRKMKIVSMPELFPVELF